MEKNPLSVIQTDQKPSKIEKTDPIAVRRREAQAKYERIWKEKPERFDPNKNCMERDRLQKTWSLLQEEFSIKGSRIVDIGCGMGILTEKLAEKNALVTALDIASNALKLVPEHKNIEKKQDALPSTLLSDDTFDIAVCTEVIAEMDHRDFRLTISELFRLIKPEGKVLVSSPIDIYSEDALERLMKLAETEFKIEKWILRHHAYYLRILHFFKAPYKFVNGWKNRQKRIEGIAKRSGLSRWWFSINSTFFPMILWIPLSLIFYPITLLLEQNRPILLFLEKVCKLIANDKGISHAMFIAKRRPMLEEKDEPPMPDRAPFRREIKWE